ncbi:MAG TPA: DUF5777 family beta-barrel protein [Flavobacteriales bacterium]|nr:DUF5777 family beta-barrel protein [Flavobacteriales bacterium]
MNFIKTAFFTCSFFTVSTGMSQDMLDDLGEEPAEVTRVTAAFKNSKVINAQSTETTHKGVLDFRISHRFGMLSGGMYELFGLDQASLRLSFDYGITSRLMVGFGRSTYQKTYDEYLKYKILWQTEGSNKMPITMIWYSNMAINSLKVPENLPYEFKFSQRIVYTHQLIIGRKFTEGLTLELLPTIVHRNIVATAAEKNTVYVIGGAGRIKLTRRIALNAEYFYVLPDQLAKDATGKDVYTNSLSIGFDIETGGHVFQLHFTNSPIMIDKGYITETTQKWTDGDINFGFNISRVFTIVKPKKKTEPESEAPIE